MKWTKEQICETVRVSAMRLPIDSFLPLLQDNGSIDQDDPKKKRKFPLLNKLGRIFYRHWADIAKRNSLPLPANHHCGSQINSEWIFKLRRTESIAKVPENFWKQLTDNETIFVFVNNSNAGQDVLIRACFEQFWSAQETNILWKSQHDAVCVAIAMCYLNICQVMAQYLSKLKSHENLDQTHDTELAFFQEVLEIYLQSNFITFDHLSWTVLIPKKLWSWEGSNDPHSKC